MDESQLKAFKVLLNENGSVFPSRSNVVGGRTLFKTGNWWKAILLVRVERKSGIKYQIRLYGWQKNKNGEYKQRQKFNMSRSKYLAVIIDILRQYSLGSSSPDLGYTSQRNFLSQLSQLQDELDTERQNKNKDTRKINKLTAIIGEKELLLRNSEDELKRLKLEKQDLKSKVLASKIPEFRSKLRDLRSYLSDKHKKEGFYHSFLKKNPWIFGSWYVEVKSKKSRKSGDQPDFELERYDGFHDLVEIESPHDNLFVPVGGRIKQSSDLKNSLSEIMQYVDGYIQTHLLTFYEDQKEMYKPKGYVVIGKSSQSVDRETKRLNSFLHGIEVWTYDDLLKRAERSIEFLEKRGGKKPDMKAH